MIVFNLYVERKDKMIGIIGAMQEEVTALKALMEVKEEKAIHQIPFCLGTLANQNVVLMQSGIGKVNAAYSTTLLLEYFDVDALINIGSAGGLHLHENVGDVVIGREVCYYDVDVTPDRVYGQVPGMPVTFKADEKLDALVAEVLDELGIPHHCGLIVSGDQFVSREDQVNLIKKHFPEAMCVEMEAASIAQIAYLYQTPMIVLRSLSDIFGKGGNAVQFDEYLQVASRNSAKLCKAVVEKLQ